MSEPLEIEYDVEKDNFTVKRYADGHIGWIVICAGVRCFKSYLSQVITPSEMRQLADFIEVQE